MIRSISNIYSHPIYVFVFLASCFGVLVGIITPPFQSPDESNHYHRIAHIAGGNLMCWQENGNRLGGEIDEGLLQFSTRFDRIRKSDDPTFSSKDLHWAQDLDQGQPVLVDIANVGYYSPTVYLPHVLVLSILSPLDLSPYHQSRLLRFINLLTWICLLALAIKIIPVGKLLFAFIALLPSHIALASCISGDTFTHGLCFLWIALILRASLDDHQVKWGEWLGWLSIIVLITINKLVYFPLVFLIFLIPKQHWSDRLKMMGPLLGLVALTLLLWIPYSSNLFIPYDQYNVAFRDTQQLNPGVNPSEQLLYVLSHPLIFLQTAVLSYLESAPATWAHYIGKFGWEKNYLHPIMIAILSLTLIVNVRLTSTKEPSLVLKSRKWLFICGILMIGAFTLSIYMQWSPVGHDRIRSLSGRYFIPIIPVLLLLIPRKCFSGRWLELLTFCVSTIGLMLLIWGIWVRYW